MIRTEKRGTKTSFFREYQAITILLPLLAIFAVRIPLGRLIGDEGNAFFGVAGDLCIVFAGAFSYGLCEAVAALVRYRIKREQYKNAKKVLKKAMLLGLVTGLLFTLLLAIGGGMIAEKIFKMPLAGLAIRMISPVMLFWIQTGILRGYFQGNGWKGPTVYSRILFAVFYTISTLTGAGIFHVYGEKVSALLLKEQFACAYGAMGAAAGFTLTALLCFLHVLIMYFAFDRSMGGQVGREVLKNPDNTNHIFRMLAGSGSIYLLIWLICSCVPLTNQLLLFFSKPDEQTIIAVWGQYYGRYLAVLGLGIIIFCLIFLIPVRRIVYSQDRLDYRLSGDKLGLLIHQTAAVTIPAAILLAVFSENMMSLFWDGNNQQTAQWLQMGSILLVLMTFSFIFMELLFRSRKFVQVLIILAGALVIHMAIVILLMMNTKLGITSLIIGNIFFALITAAAGFLLVGRLFQYKQEWIHSFAITIVAAAISGVIAMLLNKAFTPILGSTVSILICLPVSCVVYIVLLVVGRGFREEEMENIAGGSLLLRLSELFHIQ